MTDPRSVVLHGHFYQPPREDPWTGRIPEQPSAAPFHDWNERIEHECYAPVVSSLEWMSFDFGPTLLEWMERHAPGTYAAVIAADRVSCERLEGHGNAIAMPYHHPILPLSDPRDRVTEIRWGIHDFRRRFGREPEGMWLPETAVDASTLDAVAEEGILFTILAPHQVREPPPNGLPARYVTASGRVIALFVYDGALSHGVAFGDLLKDGVAWARRLEGAEDPRLLRSLATDGETFGHHHEFGEMALAKAIVELESSELARLENFASFLARHGAEHEVELVEPSAWSCPHGVDRWRADCGCRANTDTASSQAWRAPLRSAVTWLAKRIHRVYERETAAFPGDAWQVRDAYGAVVGAPDQGARRAFVRDWLGPRAEVAEVGRALEMLELERNALRLFTSCAWFFDDIGGIEATQVLRYAARAIDLLGPEGASVEAGFLERLEPTLNNDPVQASP